MNRQPVPAAEQLRPSEVAAKAGLATLEMIGGVILGAMTGAAQGARDVRALWRRREIDLRTLETFVNDPMQHEDIE